MPRQSFNKDRLRVDHRLRPARGISPGDPHRGFLGLSLHQLPGNGLHQLPSLQLQVDLQPQPEDLRQMPTMGIGPYPTRRQPLGTCQGRRTPGRLPDDAFLRDQGTWLGGIYPILDAEGESSGSGCNTALFRFEAGRRRPFWFKHCESPKPTSFTSWKILHQVDA